MITAIGNPVYDYIKTQKIETDGRVLSGCSTNAALALTKLGEKVRLVGAVGNDFKAKFIEKLKSYNIEPVIVPSKGTGGFSLFITMISAIGLWICWGGRLRSGILIRSTIRIRRRF